MKHDGQIRDETAGRAAGVTKALLELYEVVTHEFLAPNLRYAVLFLGTGKHCQLQLVSVANNLFLACREQFDTWQLLLRARNDGRLFSKIFWPKDPEMVLVL